MSLRFFRRKSILGGLVLINASRSGLSLSVGMPGARFTFPIWGDRLYPRATVGLPGTGLSYTEQLKRK